MAEGKEVIVFYVLSIRTGQGGRSSSGVPVTICV